MTDTCKTCRFWTSPIDEDQKDGWEKLGTCDNPKIKRSYHVRIEDIPDDGALVEDDEGWGLYTATEFGCVGHEPVAVHSGPPVQEGE